MLVPDPTELMSAPCQKAAENLTRKWQTYSLTGSTIPNLQHQLYLWSIEGKPLHERFIFRIFVPLMINDSYQITHYFIN